MKKASQELVNFLASEKSEAIRIADLYCFSLTNGTTMNLTSADFDITHNGKVYSCNNACISRDEISWQTGLSVDDVTVELNPQDTDKLGKIPLVEAFRKGLFDGATLTIDLAFYKDGWHKEPLVLENLFGGNVDVEEVSGNYVKLNIKSITELLNQDFPSQVYQASCSYALYCKACGVSKMSHSERNYVQPNSTKKKIKCILRRTGTYYQNGIIQFISGDNVNIKKSVKKQSDGEIELSTPLPHEPKEGDSFYVYAGCDKTMSMCKNKFKNFANFNGTPFIPKADPSL